jgi:hypothetical protein
MRRWRDCGWIECIISETSDRLNRLRSDDDGRPCPPHVCERFLGGQSGAAGDAICGDERGASRVSDLAVDIDDALFCVRRDKRQAPFELLRRQAREVENRTFR